MTALIRRSRSRVSPVRSGRGRVTFAEAARLERLGQDAEARYLDEQAKQTERRELRGFRWGSGVVVPQSRLVSRDASVLYPVAYEPATAPEGVFMGVDVSAGQTPFFVDPWLSYAEESIQDTNAFVSGALGQGKSATVKAKILREARIYGPQRRFPMVVSPKPEEYDRLAEELGWDVIRLGPDSDDRINPMDVPGVGRAQALLHKKLCRELVEAVNKRPLSPAARAVLEDAVGSLCQCEAEFTLADVLRQLASPEPELLASLRRSKKEILDDSVDARAGLQVLAGRERGAGSDGLFGGRSTVNIDWGRSNGVLVDMSSTSETDAFVPMLLVAAVWLREAWKVRRAALPNCVAFQVLDESWELIVFAGDTLRADLKKSRSLGLSTWFVAHRDADVDASADDGSAAAKVAKNLLSDVSTRIMFRDSATVAGQYAEMMGLSPRQREWIPQLMRGRCLWLAPNESRVVQVLLSGCEQTLFYTDEAMRAGVVGQL